MASRKRTDLRTEKQVEHSGDLLMAALGFTVIRFSQARATMQSAGIPDRKYFNPEKRLALWWECKREGGRVSAFQEAFKRVAEACGETVVVGTDSVLLDWCVERGLCERVGPAGVRVIRG